MCKVLGAHSRWLGPYLLCAVFSLKSPFPQPCLLDLHQGRIGGLSKVTELTHSRGTIPAQACGTPSPDGAK